MTPVHQWKLVRGGKLYRHRRGKSYNDGWDIVTIVNPIVLSEPENRYTKNNDFELFTKILKYLTNRYHAGVNLYDVDYFEYDFIAATLNEGVRFLS